MAKLRDVVVTGLGAVCPLGVGVVALWEGLLASRSGIDWIDPLRGTGLPFRFAGQVKDFDAKQYVQPRKTIKVMCQEIQTAFAAAAQAMESAGLRRGDYDPQRLGVVLGSEMLYGELPEMADVYRHCAVDGQFDASRWGEFAFKDLFPLWMLKYLPNMAACHISIAHDAQGPNNSIVAGGVSSLLAIAEAAAIIQRGHADAMLAGGSGSLASISSLPFRGWKHLSTWEGSPAEAIRPFEADRCGTVPGEGAGVLLLESREHAQRRGARPLVRVAGWASRCQSPATPWAERDGRALEQALAAALRSAEQTPSQIDHVNAHGDGSPIEDRVEAKAIHAVLGQTPVTALKSYFGDLGAGSGAVELIGSILALVHGQTPPTRNYERPDPACPVEVVRQAPRPVERPAVLAVNQSWTGQAAALVIVREEE
jgi:3-oxoacyl-[acyl-carrier-protein] synthase II